MKLKDLMEQYGEYDIVLSKRDVTNEIMIEGRKPKPKTVWDLIKGNTYYLIDRDGEVMQAEYAKLPQYKHIEMGNAFLTKEEAEKEVERRKVETLLLKHGGRRWFKQDNLTDKNWSLRYNDTSEELNVCNWAFRQGTIFFDSREQAENAIEQIGADRIRKALFEVR